jgi:hypothetical protein
MWLRIKMNMNKNLREKKISSAHNKVVMTSQSLLARKDELEKKKYSESQISRGVNS